MNNKVLLCDNKVFMRKMLSRSLTMNSYNLACEAENGWVPMSKLQNLKDNKVSDLNDSCTLDEVLENNSLAKVIIYSTMGKKGIVINIMKNDNSDLVTESFEADRVFNSYEKFCA